MSRDEDVLQQTRWRRGRREPADQAADPCPAMVGSQPVLPQEATLWDTACGPE